MCSNKPNMVKDINLDLVDDTPIAFDVDDPPVANVFKEISSVADKYKAIGDWLEIKHKIMKQIAAEHKTDYPSGLKAVIEELLKGTHNMKLFGSLNWALLVRVISNTDGGNHHALAQRLARDHKKVGGTMHAVQESPGDHVDITLQQRMMATSQSGYPPPGAYQQQAGGPTLQYQGTQQGAFQQGVPQPGFSQQHFVHQGVAQGPTVPTSQNPAPQGGSYRAHQQMHRNTAVSTSQNPADQQGGSYGAHQQMHRNTVPTSQNPAPQGGPYGIHQPVQLSASAPVGGQHRVVGTHGSLSYPNLPQHHPSQDARRSSLPTRGQQSSLTASTLCSIAESDLHPSFYIDSLPAGASASNTNINVQTSQYEPNPSASMPMSTSSAQGFQPVDPRLGHSSYAQNQSVPQGVCAVSTAGYGGSQTHGQQQTWSQAGQFNTQGAGNQPVVSRIPSGEQPSQFAPHQSRGGSVTPPPPPRQQPAPAGSFHSPQVSRKTNAMPAPSTPKEQFTQTKISPRGGYSGQQGPNVAQLKESFEQLSLDPDYTCTSRPIPGEQQSLDTLDSRYGEGNPETLSTLRPTNTAPHSGIESTLSSQSPVNTPPQPPRADQTQRSTSNASNLSSQSNPKEASFTQASYPSPQRMASRTSTASSHSSEASFDKHPSYQRNVSNMSNQSGYSEGSPANFSRRIVHPPAQRSESTASNMSSQSGEGSIHMSGYQIIQKPPNRSESFASSQNSEDSWVNISNPGPPNYQAQHSATSNSSGPSSSTKFLQEGYAGKEIEESGSEYSVGNQFNRGESIQSKSSDTSDYQSSVTGMYQTTQYTSSAQSRGDVMRQPPYPPENPQQPSHQPGTFSTQYADFRGGDPHYPAESANFPGQNQPKNYAANYSMHSQPSVGMASSVMHRPIAQYPTDQHQPVYQTQLPPSIHPAKIQPRIPAGGDPKYNYPAPPGTADPSGQNPRLVFNPRLHPSLASSQGSSQSSQAVENARKQQDPLPQLAETPHYDEEMRVEDIEENPTYEERHITCESMMSAIHFVNPEQPASACNYSMESYQSQNFEAMSHQAPSDVGGHGVHDTVSSGLSHSIYEFREQKHYEEFSSQAPSDVGGHGVHGQAIQSMTHVEQQHVVIAQADLHNREKLDEKDSTAAPPGNVEVAVAFDYASLMVQESKDPDVQTDGGPTPRKVIRKKASLPSPDRVQTIKLSFGPVTPENRPYQPSSLEDRYDMTRQNHGYAVIINNDSFSHLKKREGSQVDEENLTLTFCYLGFSVEVHHNLTANQMTDLFREISKRDHSKFDCFVCCILTHGKAEGRIAGTDSTFVEIDTLTASLCADPCPSLKGKPKIFFIQACRGKMKCQKVIVDGGESEEDNRDEESDDDYFLPDGDEGSRLQLAIEKSLASQYPPGIDRSLSVDYDGGQPDSFRVEADAEIPDATDFFFGFATPSGHVAWRDLDHGSWYISELCRALCKYSSCLSLNDIMLRVHNEVGDKYGTAVYKQAPETTTRLRKKVYF